MKNRVVSVPINSIKLEENEQLDLKKVSLSLLKDGAVATHGIYIEEESLATIQSSIGNKPILCAYETDEDGNKTDFKGHEIKYKITKNGKSIEIEKIYIEQPVGVIPESCNFEVKDIEGENWVTCEAYLYNEYCSDAVRILNEADGNKSVSIEFQILDGFDGDDGLYHVTKIHFLGVTLLGNGHNPAIFGADVTMFTQEQNALFATQFSKIVEHVNKLNISKGGANMDKREQIISRFESLKGNVEFEKIVSNEGLTLEDLENQLLSLSCSQISSAVRESINNFEVEVTNRWNETYKIQKYYVEDIIINDNLVICEDNQNYYAYYGIPFTMDGDKAVIDFEKAKRFTRGDWRPYEGEESTIPVNTMLSKEIDSVVKKFEAESKAKEEVQNILNETKIKFAELETSQATLLEEVEDLRKFKAETLEKEKELEINSVLERFAELETVEGFEEIVKSKMEFEVDDLEKTLKILAFDNGIVIGKKNSKKSFSTKEPQFINTTATTSHIEDLSEAEKRYGSFVKKYLDNH